MRESLLPAAVLFMSPWSFTPGYAEAQIDADVVSENEVAVEGGGFVVNKMGHLLTNAAPSVSASREEAGWELALSLEWGIPIGGALVLLALLGRLLASNRRKEQLRSAESRLRAAEEAAEAARQAAEEAPRPAPLGCLLEGEDSSGRPFALAIPALALGDPAGVTVGRSPAIADFFVDHDEVSREHVRLSCIGNTLYAEDLHALNGTRLNGRLLDPEERAALQDGDRLEMGPVAFSVRLVGE